MTYKKLIESLIEEEARNDLMNILNENGIKYEYVLKMGSTLENDKKADQVFWETVFWVRTNECKKTVIVGGVADDLCGICTSVLWNEKHEILWMTNKTTREDLGIKELIL